MPRKLKDTYPRLGEILLRRKLASREAIDDALALQRSELEQHRTPPRLGQILVKRNILDKNLIREILEEQKIGRGEKRVLRVDLRDANGIAVLSLEGRLDETKEPRVTRVLERLMNRGFSQIALDARKLVYINSHGISCFIAYIDEARARGGDVKFFGLSADANLLMRRLGLSRFIQTFNNESDTLKAFNLAIDDYMSRGALAEYVSASTTRFYHLSYCPAAQKIKENKRLYYQSKLHARETGRIPCKRCRP